MTGEVRTEATDTGGVDADGYIRTVEDRPIQPEFAAVVEGLLRLLSGPLASGLDSAYLYGSVARGDAQPGRSDLDVVLLFNCAPSTLERQRLEDARRSLEARHLEVSKVDFDVGCLSEVFAPEHFERWGFWLRHHCRCIHGQDRSRAFPLFRPSRSVAWAVNGDVEQVLEDYARRIGTEPEAPALARLVRQACRKAIRATNILRPAGCALWPQSLDEHVHQCVVLFPEHRQEMGYFVQNERLPTDDRQAFSARLRQHAAWLRAQLDRSRQRQ